jgi:hypothetical protein
LNAANTDTPHTVAAIGGDAVTHIPHLRRELPPKYVKLVARLYTSAIMLAANRASDQPERLTDVAQLFDRFAAVRNAAPDSTKQQLFMSPKAAQAVLTTLTRHRPDVDKDALVRCRKLAISLVPADVASENIYVPVMCKRAAGRRE